MVTYVSFLRAINVGGTGKIKMNELKELYESFGCQDVRTVLQTGNVIFKVSKLPDFAPAIEKRFGHRPEVINRKLSDIEKIIEANPFAKFKGLSPSWQLVMFLNKKPNSNAVDDLVSENETLWLKGKELYIAFQNGVGKSKLTNQKIEKALGVLGTMRNWNTLEKIALASQKH